MDFQKVESDLLKMHMINHDVVGFTKIIFDDFCFSSGFRNINFHFQSNVEYLEIYFDEAQMEKVLFNLLSNAIKFTPDGGDIWLSIEARKGDLSIKIKDNGIGIDPQYLKKLFVHFFQISEFHGQNTGYGVGLALAKSIVESHHGSLTVESKLAQNDVPGSTCFTIILLKGNKHFL
jgi:signal transduction histidine kinase